MGAQTDIYQYTDSYVTAPCAILDEWLEWLVQMSEEREF